MWVKKITVVHHRQDCIGCGSCALIASCNRVMDPEDGKATLVGSTLAKNKKDFIGEIDAIDLESNKEAAEACPVRIIKVS